MNLIELVVKRLPFSKDELLLLIETAPNRYKVHEIEKRNNRGKRMIAQPTAEVKIVQKIVLEHFKGKLPIHECAKAYRENTSIKDHAEPHGKHSYLLKVDFKDFFPSITSEDFCNHFEKYVEVERPVIEAFSRIFFWRPKRTNKLVLAIGAPSSPWLSNTMLFDFDTKLSAYCKKEGIVYTRYADDLALSTNNPNVLTEALAYIRALCVELAYPRLTINDDKTVFTSKKRNRTLTGLVLANDGSVSIGRERKREIRALANNYDKGLIDMEKVSYLRGLLSFTLSIDRSFNASIVRMIGIEKYTKLMQ